MKSILINIIIALTAVVSFISCADSNISDMDLKGNCMVTAFAVDNYKGTMNLTDRSITVRVPENYDNSLMTVTDLEISEGAESNIKKGEQVCLTAPRVIHITNGDVYQDWTVNIKHDEARITSFKINDTYSGIINEDAKTISVYVPENLDITKLVPTITYSTEAAISPMNGIPTNFTTPVQYIVTNNTATSVYTVTVTPIGKPSAVYVGLASSMDKLNMEEQTACKWMLENVSNSIYVSFDDIKGGNVDLSNCKVIWWHFHKDGGVDGKAAFESAAPEAVNAIPELRRYYNNGGSFLFTRYATYMPAEIGAVANDGCPNNCWGQNETSAETVSSPWSFSMAGHTNHPLYNNIILGTDKNQVYTCEAGYQITNSTAQWHIGSDWGGYADYNAWRDKTGGKDIGYGGDGAIVAWEFPSNGTRGGILCIGSGCYDWYTTGTITGNYHNNVATMTLNAFNYLMNK